LTREWVSGQHEDRVTVFESLTKFCANRLYQLVVPTVARRLRSVAGQAQNLEELVDCLAQFRTWGVSLAPSQVRQEIVQLLTILQANPPATVLEIGTFRGGTFFLLSRVARDDGFLITMDLPEFQGGRARQRQALYRSFAGPKQRVEAVGADSHAPAAVRQIQDLLAGRPLDLLFIDGDHSYAGIKTDYELYSPLVRRGGLIAFHDIVPGLPKKVGGVPQFWEELKRAHPVRELVADWSQGGFGIGLLTRE
jgi:predicted O-methyltransferase YrrM